jgi:hypothetical protein
VANTTETTQRDPRTDLDEHLPEILDDVLGRLSQVGVERLLALAAEMVEARVDAPPTAHLAPGAGQQN